VRHSAVTPRTGTTHKPELVTNGQLGVTFIDTPASSYRSAGRMSSSIPTSRAGFSCSSVCGNGIEPARPASDRCVLVTHAHFDHLHRQSLRTIARQTRRQTGTAPTLVVPHHVSIWSRIWL